MSLSFVLFSIWGTPVRLWWSSVVSRMPYLALCSWGTSGFHLVVLWCVYFWAWFEYDTLCICSWKYNRML